MQVKKLTEDNGRLAVQIEIMQEVLEQGSVESTRNTDDPLIGEPFIQYDDIDEFLSEEEILATRQEGEENSSQALLVTQYPQTYLTTTPTRSNKPSDQYKPLYKRHPMKTMASIISQKNSFNLTDPPKVKMNHNLGMEDKLNAMCMTDKKYLDHQVKKNEKMKKYAF